VGAGDSKEAVLKYREELYRRCSAAAHISGLNGARPLDRKTPDSKSAEVLVTALASKEGESQAKAAKVDAPSAERKSKGGSVPHEIKDNEQASKKKRGKSSKTNDNKEAAGKRQSIEDAPGKGNKQDTSDHELNPKRAKTHGADQLAQQSYSSMLEDAPAASLAHQRVKLNAEKRYYTFKLRRDGVRSEIFVTLGSTGDDHDASAKICRLCYVKMESGASKDEVIAYRNELLKHMWSGQTKQAPQKMDSQMVIGQLEKEGKLAGAVQINGRDPDKKNSSVNGIYSLLTQGVDGAPAYEHVAGGSKKWFLYYSSEKKRWKISNTLGGSANVAYIQNDGDIGVPPSDLQRKNRWRIFVSKKQGYEKDKAVVCTKYGDAPEVEKKQTKKQEETEEASDEKGTDDESSNEEEDGGTAAQVASETADSSSGSSASSSRGDESSASEQLPVPRASVKTKPSKKSLVMVTVYQTPDAGPKRSAEQLSGASLEKRGRVCAKMMVRTGWRCPCHFSLWKDCRLRAAA